MCMQTLSWATHHAPASCGGTRRFHITVEEHMLEHKKTEMYKQPSKQNKLFFYSLHWKIRLVILLTLKLHIESRVETLLLLYLDIV